MSCHYHGLSRVGGGIHDAYAFCSPVNVVTLEIRYPFSIIAAFLFNPLNAKLNPICHLRAVLGTHPILHVSRIRVKSSSSFIIMVPILENLLTFSLCLSFNRQKSRQHFVYRTSNFFGVVVLVSAIILRFNVLTPILDHRLQNSTFRHLPSQPEATLSYIQRLSEARSVCPATRREVVTVVLLKDD